MSRPEDHLAPSTDVDFDVAIDLPVHSFAIHPLVPRNVVEQGKLYCCWFDDSLVFRAGMCLDLPVYAGSVFLGQKTPRWPLHRSEQILCYVVLHQHDQHHRGVPLAVANYLEATHLDVEKMVINAGFLHRRRVRGPPPFWRRRHCHDKELSVLI